MTARTWKEQIPGCFVGPFAAHANDEERAFQLLTAARREHVGWAELKAAFEDFLGKRMTALDGDGPQQMAEVERYFRPWLAD